MSGPAWLRPERAVRVRGLGGRIRGGVRGGGRRGSPRGARLQPTVRGGPLHGAARPAGARHEARNPRHEEPALALQPGHAPRHRRRTLGGGARAFPGPRRAAGDAAVAGEERPVRACAVRRVAPLLRGGGGLLKGAAASSPPAHAPQTPARGRSQGVRIYHTRTAGTHLSETLRGLRRLPR